MSERDRWAAVDALWVGNHCNKEFNSYLPDTQKRNTGLG